MAFRWVESDAKKSEKERKIEVRTTKTIETQKAEEECREQTVMKPAGKFNFVASPHIIICLSNRWKCFIFLF